MENFQTRLNRSVYTSVADWNSTVLISYNKYNHNMTAKSFRSSETGYSLIELLIVVAVIGVIASMVIPNLLQSRTAANETVAIGYMRSWCVAQELYHMRHGFYADADNQLFDEGLIDGHAPADSHGYNFSIDNGFNSRYAWVGNGTT